MMGINNKTMAKNKFLINGNISILYLNRRDGEIIEAIIDTEDLDIIIKYPYKWYAKSINFPRDFYVLANLYKESPIFLHRFLMNFPDDKVDHINNQPLDNRKSNLRLSDALTNTKNRKSRNSNNTSGHRNVCLSGGLYIVQLQVDGKNKSFLKTKNYDEACRLADELRDKYYGEFQGPPV